MKQKIKTWAALAFSAIILFSCSKDDDDGGSQTKTSLLTSSSWKLIAYTANPAEDWNGDGQNETDLYAAMNACEKDHTLTFKTNGDMVTDYKTLCDYEAGDPQTQTDKWRFADNEASLIITEEGDDEDPFSIVELTATRLKIRNSYTDRNGTQHTYEQTYSH